MVFFESCKIEIHSYDEYVKVSSHFIDVLHGPSMDLPNDKFPMYIFIHSNMTVEHSYSEGEYERRKLKKVSVGNFNSFKYVISSHFKNRFMERYVKVSDARFKTLLKRMIKSGTMLKRRDAIKALKYHKTSDYILYSNHDGNEKCHYMMVLTDQNILTTIYKFEDIKDLKYFKEV